MTIENDDVTLSADSVLTTFQQYFNFPESREELLQMGQLTERQITVLTMYITGSPMSEISEALNRNRKTNNKRTATFNAYDALNSAVNRCIQAVALIKAMTLEDDALLVGIIDRVLSLEKKTKPKRRFIADVKQEIKNSGD
jgi:hypothetical protein